MEDQENLDTFIQRIHQHDAPFYREHWGGVQKFAELPVVTREDFLKTPLSLRRYKDEKALIKIVHDPAGAFLSEWSFVDIGREAYGLPARRPMVFLENPHEAIEKSMWCYEHGMLPLVGEKTLEIATYAAEKYKIDSLITDTSSLIKLEPYVRGRGPLDSISILGERFEPKELLHFGQYARQVRLVLALPETGAIAAAALAAEPRWEALPDCILENTETLLVTKKRLLVTPIVRYQTTLPPLNNYDGAL
ncbi:MAG TPA: hypothetical protein VJJ20_03810 [Candidatus Paceibacterota bacterium]